MTTLFDRGLFLVALFLMAATTTTTTRMTTTNAYQMTSFSTTTTRSAMAMKRGRGSLKKELGGDGSACGSSGGGMGSSSSSFSSSSSLSSAAAGNWLEVPDSKATRDLPTQEGTVSLLETQAFLLKNPRTNPNGAVSVMKYNDETYCFDANCPNCKIPMTKAKALPPNEETQNKAPRVVCDFCQSTYNLQTGERLKSQEQGGGILGGIAKAVMGAQTSGPLSVYRLGEKNGKIMFGMD